MDYVGKETITKWKKLQKPSGEQLWNDRGKKFNETESKRGVNDFKNVWGPW